MGDTAAVHRSCSQLTGRLNGRLLTTLISTTTSTSHTTHNIPLRLASLVSGSDDGFYQRLHIYLHMAYPALGKRNSMCDRQNARSPANVLPALQSRIGALKFARLFMTLLLGQTIATLLMNAKM